MRKFLLYSILSCIPFIGFGQNYHNVSASSISTEGVNNTNDYCNVTYTDNIEPITFVSFAGIDNRTSGTLNGTPPMEDFTSMTGNVEPGGIYELILEGNTDGNFTNTFTLFVDWNQDGDFTDAGEMYQAGSIFNSTGNDGVQAITSITVPENAMPGTTRMRIIKDWTFTSGPVWPSDPCGTYDYGQTEDYSLVVSGDSSGGDECHQEFTGTINNGVGIINNGASHYRAANDIDVPAGGTFTIEKISAEIVSLSGAPTTFDIYIYEDASGPGTLLTSYLGVAPTITPNGTFGSAGYPKFTVTYELDTPYLLSASESADSKFWIAFTGYPSVDSQNVYWVSSTHSSGSTSSPTYQSDNGGSSWFVFVDSNENNVEGFMKVEGTCTLAVADMQDFDFSYYPNPVKEELNITSQKAVQSIAVYNTVGQQVAAYKMNANTGKVNTSSLAPGIYVFRVILDGGQVETFKIIKK